MASSSAGGPAAAAGPSTTAGASRARSKKDQLFERCLEKPLGYVFALGDLEQYGIAETQEDVLALADQLCDAHLFIMMQTAEKEVMWKLRPKETADLYVYLASLSRMEGSKSEEMF